ncbi:hypothetical protein [Haloferax sp. KTX1]|uniref:ABC transporter ATP-binding protein n=1 Tax=Haloferax sp. KTX1 TaxID=2600597 RepID=UPI003183D6FD
MLYIYHMILELSRSTESDQTTSVADIERRGLTEIRGGTSAAGTASLAGCTGEAVTVFAEPAHPYTRAFLSGIPSPDPSVTPNRVPLTGDVPTAAAVSHTVPSASAAERQKRCPLSEAFSRRVMHSRHGRRPPRSSRSRRRGSGSRARVGAVQDRT